ncbi:hypothetical protein SCUCBS95973_006118 [Sporothrix curviconia]|uniref:Major facilitator superfamily (MFS) profile domain-containing protein n=1 Tax=Sporothrix curviconia TaxID=1260050 RepID=A0ABP0C2H8_9PEZI
MDPPLDEGIVSTTTLVPHNGSTTTLVDEFEADLGAFTPTTEVGEIVFSVAPASNGKKTDAVNREVADKKRRPSTPAALPALDPCTLPPVETVAPTAHDGGTTAWCQVAAGFLLNAIAWGTSMMFGVYQLYYTQTLGLDSAAVSWVGSVQTFITYFLSIVSGLLADADYARQVTVAGTVLVVAGGMGMSFAAPVAPAVVVPGQPVPPALFLSQAVIMGVGLGLLTAPALPSINGFFDKRRALALAVSTMGTSTGGALLPVVVQFLLPAIGFGWAVRCATLLALVVCAMATLLLRPPPTPASTSGKVGLSSSSPTPATRSLAARVSSLARKIVDVSAFHEVPFLLFLASTFLLYWGLYFGFYYINVYAEDVVGFSTNRATTLLVMSTALGIPARLAAGSIANAGVGALDTQIVSTVVLAGTIFGWLAVGTSTAGMYVFVVLFGLGNGAVQSVWLGSISELSRHAASRIGARFGTICVVAALATLAGAPTASALISMANGGNTAMQSTYHTAQIWGAATTLGSAGVLVVARVYTVGWRLRRV